jgi:hypothetical protein
MTKFTLGLATLFFLSGTAALAADLGSSDAPTFDIGFEATVVSDFMDTGFTNSDHKPAGYFKITPSYGIFSASASIQTLDHGTPEPKADAKFAIDVAPEFGNLALDFNLERRVRIDDPTGNRWLPYATATYTFSDMFNASLGGGYYFNDDAATADFGELYAGFTVGKDDGPNLATEFYYEPDSDGAGNSYYEAIATATLPFYEKWEAVGKVGYEGYQDEVSTPSYTWAEARLNYNWNDHITLGAAVHGSSLNTAACALQAYTDCDTAVFASLTVKGNASDFAR